MPVRARSVFTVAHGLRSATKLTVSVDHNHSYGLTTSGSVACRGWGWNDDANGFTPKPVLV
jgi:hypothetical protein